MLAGVGSTDTPAVVDAMAEKLVGLRYFEDDEGRTNRDLRDSGGSLLVVSQFTLYADLRRGRRPGFSHAADPSLAEPLVERFVARLRALGARGRDGAIRRRDGRGAGERGAVHPGPRLGDGPRRAGAA